MSAGAGSRKQGAAGEGVCQEHGWMRVGVQHCTGGWLVGGVAGTGGAAGVALGTSQGSPGMVQ
jgi:hypothetical protein